jgi:hypothetical protein
VSRRPGLGNQYQLTPLSVVIHQIRDHNHDEHVRCYRDLKYHERKWIEHYLKSKLIELVHGIKDRMSQQFQYSFQWKHMESVKSHESMCEQHTNQNVILKKKGPFFDWIETGDNSVPKRAESSTNEAVLGIEIDRNCDRVNRRFDAHRIERKMCILNNLKDKGLRRDQQSQLTEVIKMTVHQIQFASSLSLSPKKWMKLLPSVKKLQQRTVECPRENFEEDLGVNNR